MLFDNLKFCGVKVRNAFRYFLLPNHWALFRVKVLTSQLLETIRNTFAAFFTVEIMYRGEFLLLGGRRMCLQKA